MIIRGIKTHKVLAGESLFKILDQYILKIEDKCIVAIASKIISNCEKHLIKKIPLLDKSTLIAREADRVISTNNQKFCLTVKYNRFIPNAGIDESNAKGHYILLPRNPQLTAKKIWTYLKKKHQLRKLGVIITDSNVTPLRSGISAIAIGWCGFVPLYSYIGKKDLFENTMKATKINLIDNLATAASLVMGEGNEQRPMATLSELPITIHFKKRAPSKRELRSIIMNPRRDLFKEILKP